MDHNYIGEETIETEEHHRPDKPGHDALAEIRSSIAALSNTVQQLVAKQSAAEEPSAYPKYRKRPFNMETVSLDGGEESDDSLCEPPPPKCYRTSYRAEVTHRDTHSKSNPLAAAAKGVLQLDEELLCAVESESPQWLHYLRVTPFYLVWQSGSKVPLINEAIYKGLPNPIKRKDGDLMGIQKEILAANNAVTKIANSILDADSKSEIVNSKEIVKMTLDAVTLLGLAHSKLNNQRKSALSPALDPDIRDFYSARHEVTDYLFGDDLSKAIKEAKDLNKISNQLQKSATAHPNRYQNQRYQSNGPPQFIKILEENHQERVFSSGQKAPFKEKKPYRN
eukprot:gene3987-4536_t